MKDLILDANGWSRADDVYDAFFRAVGAPLWHGRNFDALNDSISTGQINAIEVPYRIIVTNSEQACSDARAMLEKFKGLIDDLASRGCPVEIKLR